MIELDSIEEITSLLSSSFGKAAYTTIGLRQDLYQKVLNQYIEKHKITGYINMDQIELIVNGVRVYLEPQI